MKKGDTIKILSSGQMIVVDRIKYLTNGKAIIVFHSKDENNMTTNGELYQEVLEMMGIEIQENSK
jgi:hypothetical protein